MVSKYAWLLLLFFICLTGNFAKAQQLDDYIAKYTAANGKDYLQPLANAFGASLNSGLYRSAAIKKRSLQVYVGLIGTSAIISDQKKTFVAQPEGLFEPKAPVEVSTVFGSGESVTVYGENGTSYTFPGGLNVKAFPLLIPQVTVGSWWGTDLTVRFFTYNFNKNIDRVNLLGLGIRHSISQYFPGIPVEIAAGYFWHHFTLSDFLKANSSLISLQSSYTKDMVTFYGGLGYGNSNMDINYVFEKEDPIAFGLDYNNNVRLTLGIALDIEPVVLNLGYTLARQSLISVGVGLRFEKK